MNVYNERSGVRFGLVDVPVDRDAADRVKARAFPPVDAKRDGEVGAFCGAIATLDAFDYEEAKRLVPAIPLPGGYAHFRLSLVGRPQPFHRAFQVEDKARPMTLHDVLFGVLEWPGVEVTGWSGVRFMPDVIPGVLDLELDITTKAASRPVRLRP